MAKSRLHKGADISLILSSLLVAFFIWLIAKRGETETTRRSVQVRLAHFDPICEINFEPSQMEADIQYPRSLRSIVTNDSFVIELDERDARKYAGIEKFAKYVRPISPGDLTPRRDLPKSVKPLAIASAEDKITLHARLYNCSIELETPTTGTLAQGYELTRPPIPEYVDKLRLVGTPERLEELKAGQDKVTLKTQPIGLTGLQTSELVSTPIIVPEECQLADVEGGLLEPAKWSVRVNIPITEEVVEQKIRNVPINIRPFMNAVHLEYSPTVTCVQVKGPRSLVKSLEPSSFEPIPAQPLNEMPGFVGRVEITARFSESVSEKVRNAVIIVAVDPNAMMTTMTATVEPAVPGAEPSTGKEKPAEEKGPEQENPEKKRILRWLY